MISVIKDQVQVGCLVCHKSTYFADESHIVSAPANIAVRNLVQVCLNFSISRQEKWKIANLSIFRQGGIVLIQGLNDN